MGVGFANSPGKDYVREYWNTPVLEYIFNKEKVKYNYLGFPGPEIIDIIHWQNMIAHVIAFEYIKLRKKVETALFYTGIEYVVYSGFMEETVLNNIDQEGKKFIQDRLITLYNLDFTNYITGKIPERGTTLRFDALRKIISFQRDAYFADRARDVFIMFLTVKAGYHAKHIKAYLQSELSAEVESIVSRFRTQEMINPKWSGTNAVILRTFIFDKMTNYFQTHNISSIFLPTFEYMGGSKRTTPMMHMTAICKHNKVGRSTPILLQKREEMFQIDRLRLEPNGLYKYNLHGRREISTHDPTEIISRCEGELF